MGIAQQGFVMNVYNTPEAGASPPTDRARPTARRGRPRPGRGVRVVLSVAVGLFCALLPVSVPVLAPPAAAQDVPASGPAAGGACEAGTISHVFIDNHSVFDTEELRADRSFQWAYRLANSLHVRTRAGFIRDVLLFGRGDCYDPVLLEESERLLREYEFIASVDVWGLQQPDGTWHVIVDTKDEWTTQVEVSATTDDGLSLSGASVTEQNLLGRGWMVGLFYEEREEQRDLGVRLAVPQLLGTRTRGRLAFGQTRVGSFVEQEFFHPFTGEVGRWAFRQRYLSREETFAYALSSGGPADRVLLPYREEWVEATAAHRWGEPGNLTVFGVGFSNETVDFPGFPQRVELTRGGEWDSGHEAPPGYEDELRGQTLHSAATRLNLLFGQRRITFAQRLGLDALRGVQDVPVGTDVALTVGRSVGLLSAETEDPVDVYTRLRLFAGFAPPELTANLSLGFEGRNVLAEQDEGTEQGWNDLLAEADALIYWQPPALSGHTLFLRVAGAGGWQMQHPFQLTLGGGAALRGYDDEAFPGAHRLVVSAEDRIYVAWPFPELFDLGFTVFADAGRVWAGDVPFGTDAGWRADVGGGLRIGFPAGTRSVVRLDAAWPVERGVGFGDVVVRLSMTDLLGLASPMADEQVERSRRMRVGADLFDPRRSSRQ